MILYLNVGMFSTLMYAHTSKYIDNDYVHELILTLRTSILINKEIKNFLIYMAI